jgi:uncharacterized membrane protein YkvA (DUF1232 family)
MGAGRRVPASVGDTDYDPGMPEDPFPRDRFVDMLRRLPAYLRLAWRLARDPLLSRKRRAAMVAAAGYLASPIDLVPGVIPVLGQLDDVAVAIAAIRLALDGLSPERRRLHLSAAGLTDEDLVADLRTVGATTAWIARASARTAVRMTRASGRVAMGAGRRARDLAAPRVTVIRRRLPGRLRGPADHSPGDPGAGPSAEPDLPA